MHQNSQAMMRKAWGTHASRIQVVWTSVAEAEINQCIEGSIHWWITDLMAQGAQGASALDKKLGTEISLAPEFSVLLYLTLDSNQLPQ
jgi:hypothetical protein